MIASYEQALADPNLVALSEELSVTAARAADLVARVDRGESSHLWKLLGVAVADLGTAIGDEKQDAIADAIQRVNKLITRGQADYAVWVEVGKQFDRKARLAEVERKRQAELQESLRP